MKKVLLSLAVVFGMIASANAQLVVGGGINFGGGVKSDKTSTAGATSKTSNFNFGISPKVGYLINEKLEVGASLGLSYNENTNYAQICNMADPANPGKAKNVKESKNPYFSWAIKPYARYRFFEVNGFGFWLEGVLSLGTSTEGLTKYYAYGSATEYDPYSTYDVTGWRDAAGAKAANDLQKPAGHKYSKFNGYFKVQPVITYTINEHWVLDLQLELLSFNIGGSVENTVASTGAPTVTTNDFTWGLGLFQHDPQGLTFGVSYKF